MVDRYTLMLFEHDAEMDPDSIGEWVKHADYLALEAALREALNAWASWAYESRTIHEYDESMSRLSELRKFLDDK